MTTNDTIKAVLKHTFKERPPYPQDHEPSTVASCGETPAKALEHCSGGAERWEFVSTEELPYDHAERAHAIAEALPGDWHAKPQSDEHPTCGWILEREDGLRLMLSGPSYDHPKAYKFSLYGRSRAKGQMYVEVYTPNGTRIAHPSIGVGEGKDAGQMAKDIERRLLPDAERVHKLIEAQLEKENTFAVARLAALKELCRVLGVKIPRDYHTEEPRFSAAAGKLDFDLHSDESVTIKFLSLPYAVALELAAFSKAKGLTK